MAESLSENLGNYKLQLQQVEAALTIDPDNEELIKLRKDLQEVVDLTLELVHKPVENVQVSATATSEPVSTSSHSWDVGAPCMAPYSKDNQYYEAVVDEILEDGTCTVKFNSYGNTEISLVSLLKPFDESQKTGGDGDKKFTKKDKMVAEREYKRKKAQKKAQRLKQLEEEKEEEKNKWKSFSSKTIGKYGKGKTKKSIFATPDSSLGRVGVGTCGVGGKAMTTFKKREKWQK